MDPLSVAIAVALPQGLVQVGGKLLEVSFDASLEPVKELIKERTLLEKLDHLLVHSETGDALRVVVIPLNDRRGFSCIREVSWMARLREKKLLQGHGASFKLQSESVRHCAPSAGHGRQPR